MKNIDYRKTVLNGLGQVMLQNNHITGLLFLIGIFYNSWVMGLGALAGIIAGTATAVVLKYEKNDIENGLYGFNGALLGIALLFFFKADTLSLVLIALGSVLSSIIMHYAIERKLPVFTFPFVLTTWFLMALINYFSLIPQQSQNTIPASGFDIISSAGMGFGQVMFQENIITGIIFFLAILANSRKSAVYALLGSMLGMLVAMVLSLPPNLINVGLFGFNGVLCGIALSDKKPWAYATASIILSVLIMYGMMSINLTALTAPFVFSTWIVLALKGLIKK